MSMGVALYGISNAFRESAELGLMLTDSASTSI